MNPEIKKPSKLKSLLFTEHRIPQITISKRAENIKSRIGNFFAWLTMLLAFALSIAFVFYTHSVRQHYHSPYYVPGPDVLRGMDIGLGTDAYIIIILPITLLSLFVKRRWWPLILLSAIISTISLVSLRNAYY